MTKRLIAGVDGGGTKTAYALAEPDGRIIASSQAESISYREWGIGETVARIRNNLAKLAAAAGGSLDQLTVAIGAPGYGESREADRELEKAIAGSFKGPVVLVNDAEVAYWGALGGKPGVNVVAGTGSIAFGSDRNGHSARSGGWSEKFSDEGSCYWLGRQALALYFKEADGRKPKGALYEGVRHCLKTDDDLMILTRAEELLAQRQRTAAFQKILLEAARSGDGEAIELYRAAADELAQLAVAVKDRLGLPAGSPASLTGGLAHAGEYVLPRYAALLKEQGLIYEPSQASPLAGAVLMAKAAEIRSGK